MITGHYSDYSDYSLITELHWGCTPIVHSWLVWYHFLSNQAGGSGGAGHLPPHESFAPIKQSLTGPIRSKHTVPPLQNHYRTTALQQLQAITGHYSSAMVTVITVITVITGHYSSHYSSVITEHVVPLQ